MVHVFVESYSPVTVTLQVYRRCRGDMSVCCVITQSESLVDEHNSKALAVSAASLNSSSNLPQSVAANGAVEVEEEADDDICCAAS